MILKLHSKRQFPIEMENLIVAILNIPELYNNRQDSFKLFELFSKTFNFSIKYVFWKGCNGTMHSEIDAYILNQYNYIECDSPIIDPLVIEYQSLAILVPSYLKKSKSSLFGIFEILFNIVSLVTLMVFIFILICIAKIQRKTLDLSKELSYGLGLPAYQSFQISNKSSLLRCIYISMSVLGLLSQNCYTINISAYLVKGIDDSKINIACIDEDIQFIQEFYPKIFKKSSFIEVLSQDLIRKINEINITTGICIRTHGWLKRFNIEMRNRKAELVLG